MSKRPIDEMWESIVTEYNSKNSAEEGTQLKVDLQTPKQIVEELNKTVIGQEEAKQLIAIAAWNRLLSMNNMVIGRDIEEFYFEKNNILLVGGTGCGKTHLVNALSRSVSLPVTIQDATTFTSAGYVGRDVDQSIEDLVTRATDLVYSNYDVASMSRSERDDLIRVVAEYGIVYVDEADKVRASTGAGNDVNGRKVQEGFLKLVEGSDVRVKGDSYRGTINTSNMLFIFGGAFSDLDKIISSRVNTKQMGFSAEAPKKIDKEEMLKKANVRDFTMFGMIPELLGRLSTLATLKTLDRDMIKDIFVKPDRSIMSQVINEFKSYGVHVSFTEDAIEYIVDQTMEIKLGARGLKSTCQRVLRPLYYFLPSNAMCGDIIITKELLLKIEQEGL